MNKIELYRPSNGSEGACFQEAWCCHCARDKPMSEGKDFDECEDDEVCDIIARTFAHDIDEPEYPQEWRYDTDGIPECTAFIQAGNPVPMRRCTRTLDLLAVSERPTKNV